MNINNQTILFSKAGHVPEKEVVEYLMDKKPNSIGWVVQEQDGQPLDVLQQPAADQTVDDIFGFLEQTKDQNMAMYFAKLAEGYHPEDVQPMVLDDPDENKFLSIMLEGDIVGNNTDKVHTEHFNYVNGILIPQIVEICEDNDGDIEKVMAKLRRDSFKNNFFMHVGHRAVLHMIPFKGEPLLIAKNELMKPFGWGWLSQAIGFGEKKETAPVAAAPAASASKRGWGKSKSTVRETVAQAQANANSAKPTLTTVKTSVPSTGKSMAEELIIKPPVWMHKRDDLRYFYNELTGALPSNWAKKIPIKVTQNHKFLECKNEEDVKNYRLAKMMATTGTGAAKTVTKQERLSSTATPPPPADAPPTDLPVHGPVDNTPLPIIDPASLQKVLDLVATLDHNSKAMMDPKEMQKIEAELPKFTSQVALKGIEDTMNWTNSDLFAIAATDSRAVVILLREWMAYARPYLQAELKNRQKTGQQMTVETTKTQLTPGTTKTESVVKPARSSKWGRKAA